MGGLEDKQVAILSLTVISILSNVLYLNSLVLKISRFFLGGRQSYLSRVEQNNPSSKCANRVIHCC